MTIGVPVRPVSPPGTRACLHNICKRTDAAANICTLELIETNNEIVTKGLSSSSNSDSNFNSSVAEYRNQKHTASSQCVNAMDRKSGAVTATKQLYNSSSIDAQEFEGPTSAMSAHGGGQQNSRNEIMPQTNQNKGATMDNFTDFFSKEVFHIVLQNPTTSHRFMKFCQSRACSENIEFLRKVDAYTRLLDEVTRLLSEIQTTYTSAEAPRQINLSYPSAKRLTADIKHTTQSTLPAIETIFTDAQDHVERLLATDIYPRFVRHQITTSATVALTGDKSRFRGLGDCFCLTDPSIADNPIVYASDGFVEVTGYSRNDIVPRNCRFLQGPLTDRLSVKRLRSSIDNIEETVELLLNYRKNGDPFWNLLYVSPLLNEEGNVAFFLGGQIDCSTTVHSCTDVLKILSLDDEGVSEQVGDSEIEGKYTPPGGRSITKPPSVKMPRSSFFKSFRRQEGSFLNVQARAEIGMESELVNKIGKLDFRTQVEAFYTAYSKYLVLEYSKTSTNFIIQYFSPGVTDMLSLNLPNGGIAPIFGKDIFKILSEYSMSPSVQKSLRATVRESILRGAAVSVELGLMTGVGTKRSGFSILGDRKVIRTEEKFISHWTPLKDEKGRTGWIILTIAPK